MSLDSGKDLILLPPLQALALATGRDEAKIKKELKEEGDLGTVAVKLKSSQMTLGNQKKLTIRGVFKSFKVPTLLLDPLSMSALNVPMSPLVLPGHCSDQWEEQSEAQGGDHCEDVGLK